jgi:hypothetical protein
MSNTPKPSVLQTRIKEEYKKCASDPIYFIKNYVKIQHAIRGTIPFLLFPFQEKALKDFHDNNFNIVLKSRQMGISTLVSAYSLWLMLFHSDKNILVISRTQEVAKEIVSKVRFANDSLPSWLKVQCIDNNKLSLKFKNGSRILATSSAGDAGRSFALSLLIIDEAAFIDGIDEIWTAAYPTLSTGGRAVILSTPNGVGNFFHKMWKDAEAKRNKFNTINLPWHLHPERDQEWRDEQTRNSKSAKEASQEYDCDFLTSGNTVIDLSIIDWYNKNSMKEPLDRVEADHSLWIWEYPNYSDKRSYIVSADVARGDSTDYSSFEVLDAVSLNQCAEYKGQIDPTSFGHLLVNTAGKYNNALLIIENTGIGFSVVQPVLDSGYPNTFYSDKDLKYVELHKQIITKFYAQERKMVPGFSNTMSTRPVLIARLQQYFKEKAIHIYSNRLLAELETFIWDKGKAQAMVGYNDDLVMALGIGLWVRDMALRLREETMQYSKSMVNSIHRAQYTGSSAVYTGKNAASAQESWTMKTGMNNEKENLTWLL